MSIRVPTLKINDDFYNHFVYPYHKGSKLIILVPSMARVIKDNQFTGQESHKNKKTSETEFRRF